MVGAIDLNRPSGSVNRSYLIVVDRSRCAESCCSGALRHARNLL